MNINTALSILGLTFGTYSKEEIKAAYKKASLKFHPDRNPAGAEMMQAVNDAWSTLKDLDNVQTSEEDPINAGYDDDLNDAINAVINLTGVDIEVCGSWVWLTGATKEHKEAIKEAGYKWAKKKASWYFRPEAAARGYRGNSWNMDKIRDTHGSNKVRTQYRKALTK